MLSATVTNRSRASATLTGRSTNIAATSLPPDSPSLGRVDTGTIVRTVSSGASSTPRPNRKLRNPRDRREDHVVHRSAERVLHVLTTPRSPSAQSQRRWGPGRPIRWSSVWVIFRPARNAPTVTAAVDCANSWAAVGAPRRSAGQCAPGCAHWRRPRGPPSRRSRPRAPAATARVRRPRRRVPRRG